MQNLSKILLSLVLTATVNSVKASVMYSLGTYVPYFQEAQINNSGNKTFFDTNPYLGLGSPLKLNEDFYFVPEFGFVHYLQTATHIKKDIVLLHYDFSYVLTPSFLLRFGLSTNWLMIKGEGGKQNLKNGSGDRNFDSPSGTHTSYFTTWDLGLEGFIKEGLGLRFDLQIMNVKEFEERQYNYIFSFNFYR